MIDSAEWIIVINHSLCLKMILFLREFLFFFVLLQKPASNFYLICSSNFPISTNTKKVHSSQEVALWIWVRKWLQWQWVHGLRLLRIRRVLFRVSTILKKIMHYIICNAKHKLCNVSNLFNFAVMIMKEPMRRRNICEQSKMLHVQRLWDLSLRSGRPRLEKMGDILILWMRMDSH